MVNWANLITIGRILAIPIFILVLYLPIEYKGWVAAGVFCVIAASDAVDGWLARKHKQVTRFGTIMDPLADKLLIATALIFLIGKGVPAWIAAVLIFRELAIVGMRLLVARSVVIPASNLGKVKTTLEMAGIVAVLVNFVFAWWILLGAVVFSLASAGEYMWKYRKILVKLERH